MNFYMKISIKLFSEPIQENDFKLDRVVQCDKLYVLSIFLTHMTSTTGLGPRGHRCHMDTFLLSLLCFNILLFICLSRIFIAFGDITLYSWHQLHGSVIALRKG